MSYFHLAMSAHDLKNVNNLDEDMRTKDAQPANLDSIWWQQWPMCGFLCQFC